MTEAPIPAYRRHLQSSESLLTTYEATRAGFIALALERNRRATPYVEEARALQITASQAKVPADILSLSGIEMGLLTAAGLSQKSLAHLQPQDKAEALNGLIKNFLEPAGEKFVEELVFRFLLTRGDTLGGSLRNVGGILAQRKLTRAIIAALSIGGMDYQWHSGKTRSWSPKSDDDADIEIFLNGLSWDNGRGPRTLIYNLSVPLVKNNVDICLFSLHRDELATTRYRLWQSYLALGELKGGVDPSGADEHWKTAQTALERIRDAFKSVSLTPATFFIGAAVEKKMAREVWEQLENGLLTNAANLNDPDQVASISRWLCSL